MLSISAYDSACRPTFVIFAVWGACVGRWSDVWFPPGKADDMLADPAVGLVYVAV